MLVFFFSHIYLLQSLPLIPSYLTLTVAREPGKWQRLVDQMDQRTSSVKTVLNRNMYRLWFITTHHPRISKNSKNWISSTHWFTNRAASQMLQSQWCTCVPGPSLAGLVPVPTQDRLPQSSVKCGSGMNWYIFTWAISIWGLPWWLSW